MIREGEPERKQGIEYPYYIRNDLYLLIEAGFTDADAAAIVNVLHPEIVLTQDSVSSWWSYYKRKGGQRGRIRQTLEA